MENSLAVTISAFILGSKLPVTADIALEMRTRIIKSSEVKD